MYLNNTLQSGAVSRTGWDATSLALKYIYYIFKDLTPNEQQIVTNLQLLVIHKSIIL